MPLTATNMLLFTRQLYLDTDTETTRQALSDAELYRLLNENYIRTRDPLSPRLLWESATTLGGTLAQSDRSVLLSPTTIAEIKHVFREAAVGDKKGTPMTRDDLSRVLRLQNTETTEAAPRIYALQREETFTAASVGKWRVYFWPIPDAAATYYLSAIVRHEITELSTGTDKPDVSDGETYTICRLAAADAAYQAGRPQELIDRILAPVPEKMKAHFAVALRSVNTRASEGSAVA